MMLMVLWIKNIKDFFSSINNINTIAMHISSYKLLLSIGWQPKNERYWNRQIFLTKNIQIVCSIDCSAKIIFENELILGSKERKCRESKKKKREKNSSVELWHTDVNQFVCQLNYRSNELFVVNRVGFVLRRKSQQTGKSKIMAVDICFVLFDRGEMKENTSSQSLIE